MDKVANRWKEKGEASKLEEARTVTPLDFLRERNRLLARRRKSKRLLKRVVAR